MSFSLKKEGVIQKISLSGRWHAKLATTLLIFLLTANYLAASPTSQQVVIKKFNVSNVTLEECLKSIKKATNIGLYYNAVEIADAPRITIKESNITLTNLLDKVFAGTGYEYAIKEGTIVVKKSSKNNNQEKIKGSQVARGTVTNEKGEPIPGATVKVAGLNIGVATNPDGQFTIVVPEGRTTLSVSFVGYESTNVVLGSNNIYNVILKEDSKLLNEVVITGFGTISKERSTGAVTTINSTELERKTSFDLDNSLEGKIPGLNSYKGDAVIRGKSSFLANAYPLVVVDGLPIEGTLSSVNVLDVESVNVLKDAASASIYGSRAANGVIVVTTKSGQKGKTVVDFSADFSVNPHSKMSDFRYASTSDIIDYERNYLENDPEYISNPLKYFQDKDAKKESYSLVQEAYYNELKGLITPEEKEAQIQKLKGYDYRKEYERLILQNSITQMYNLALRKGADKVDVSFSVNYRKQKYNTINSNSNNVTINFKNKLTPYKWVTLTYGLYTSIYKSKSGLGAASATTYMPYERILDDDGNRNRIVNNRLLNDYLKSIKGLYGMEFNAFDEMEQSWSNNNNLQLRAFAEMDVNLYKGLSYNLKFQYQRDNNENTETYLKESRAMRDKINRFAQMENGNIRYTIPDNGRLLTQTDRNDNYTIRNQLSFNQPFAEDFALSAFAGTEFREFTTSLIRTDIFGYDPISSPSGVPVNWDELRKGVYGMLYPQSRQITGPSQFSAYNLNREFSMYVNGSISYKTRYTIAGSWRVDQTNLFGVAPENKFRPLWSVSGSWNVSEERFMDQVKWLNMIKVRGSLGVNGNVDRSTSPYMRARLGTSPDVNDMYTQISSPPNPLLRWEKTKILNAGIDFSMFSNRLSGSVDVYNKHTTDLIANADLDPATGFSTAKFNNGAMLNRGIEFSLSYDWVDGKTWGASTGFIIAYNKNEVKKIDQSPKIASDLINYPTSYYRIGDPYNALYAYRYAGLTANGDPSVYNKNGEIVENTGVMKDVDALVYMGQYDPTTTGSVSQSVRYKNLSIDALLVLYAGHQLRMDVVSLAGKASASMREGINDRWTVDNKTSEIPRFPVYGLTGDRSNFWAYADKHVKSASMVKLRNIGLRYSIGSRTLSKLKMQALQLKAQVNNLWYWAACGDGIDPENYNTKSGVRTGANRPTFIFGVNLTF